VSDLQLFDEPTPYLPDGVSACRNPTADDLDARFTYEATYISGEDARSLVFQMATLSPAEDGRWHVRVCDRSGSVETRQPIRAELTGLYLRDAGWLHPAVWMMKPLRAASSSTRLGYVYVIGAAGSDLVKIGYARNVESRLSDLQCGSPLKLYVVAKFRGSREDEAHAHRHFAPFRRHGEWFTSEVRRSAQDAATKLGTTVEAWLLGDVA
jgi:hypothetical protein